MYSSVKTAGRIRSSLSLRPADIPGHYNETSSQLSLEWKKFFITSGVNFPKNFIIVDISHMLLLLLAVIFAHKMESRGADEGGSSNRGVEKRQHNTNCYKNLTFKNV